MANTLTVSQIEAAENTYINNGNIAGFYAYMAGQGYNYGVLAGGLVDGTSKSGQIAVAFMQQSAANQGVTLTNTQITQIEAQMAPCANMNAYYEVRLSNGSACQFYIIQR
jgi:hypothetical protein